LPDQRQANKSASICVGGLRREPVKKNRARANGWVSGQKRNRIYLLAAERQENAKRTAAIRTARTVAMVYVDVVCVERIDNMRLILIFLCIKLYDFSYFIVVHHSVNTASNDSPVMPVCIVLR
jgi:hypothetical protein